MGWIIAFGILVLFLMFRSNGNNTVEMESAIAVTDEAFRFIEYCESHVDELPQHVKERFDEMKERIDRIKER